ncbi:MAG: cupin domain-containing protein [Candidatus Promineifilaceae bacterium]|nr:cupin domain-containing protein [Candidatus Promineifilaceae bacterium]
MRHRGRVLIRRRGVGQRLTTTGNEVIIKVSGEDTEGAFALLECALRPGDSSPPPHRHAFSELFYVLEGTLAVDLNGQRYRAAAGAIVYVSGGAVHTFAADGGSTVRFLVLAVPSGIENYFLELKQVLADLSPWAQEAEAVQDRMVRLLRKYGIETVAAA